jgi:3'(2'), 5'-bisphosphate nucleotidase
LPKRFPHLILKPKINKFRTIDFPVALHKIAPLDNPLEIVPLLNIGLGFVNQIVDITRRAGNEIMRVYDTDFEVQTKGDASPVTAADQLAENLILRSIREGLTDKFPIVSEEAASDGVIPDIKGHSFWLVDPLDGTKEFVNRNGEFTVNIALIEHSKPVLGVVHLPTKNTTYFAASIGAFVQREDNPAEQIQCRTPSAEGVCAVVSRSHRTSEVDDYLKDYTVINEISAGSSLKFCTVAEGSADIYPRLGRTMEWDTAAGHAVLRFAGGSVKKLDGTDLNYGKDGFENPHFIASGPGVEPNS